MSLFGGKGIDIQYPLTPKSVNLTDFTVYPQTILLINCMGAS